MVGRDVDGYAREYSGYFGEHEPHARERKAMFDGAPRVVIDPELGVCTAGRTARDAAIVFDIYSHTMQSIQRSERLGGWRPVSARDAFDVDHVHTAGGCRFESSRSSSLSRGAVRIIRALEERGF